MIKSWYIHVREETMAPARMITFIEDHAMSCDVCRQDPDLKEEIARITELVLPESKIPKAVRQRSSMEDEEGSEDEMDIDDNDDDESSDSLDEEAEDEDDLDLDDDDELSSEIDDDI